MVANVRKTQPPTSMAQATVAFLLARLSMELARILMAGGMLITKIVQQH
jgi:hypothetical protein